MDRLEGPAERVGVSDRGGWGPRVDLIWSHVGRIDMVLSDVIIPGVSGPEIVHRVQSVFKGTKALFMSGYTDHAILRDGALEIGTSFIQKPFAPEALAKKVREVLDASCELSAGVPAA